MKIFNGKKVAEKILKETAAAIKKEKIRPVLAVLSVGEDEASKIYIKLKKDAGAKIGIEVAEYHFEAQTQEDLIIEKIESLNKDEQVSGLIVQLPLPAILNTERIIKAIDPKKDVDGFHPENRKLLEKNKPWFWPVLPSAILLAIKTALKNNFKGKKALALVNSEVFGQTLKLILEREGLSLAYQVKNTCIVLGAEKEIKSADILISVCGCAKMIKAEMIKNEAILIDAGITRYHDGKVVGDIDQESVKDKAAFLTPVPGGIGPLTVALLLRNVYLAELGKRT